MKLKTRLIALFCLALALTVRAQERFTVDSVNAAETVDGLRISGARVTFPLDFYVGKLSEHGDRMAVFLRQQNKKGTKWKNKGQLLMADTRSWNTLWQSEMNYLTQTATMTAAGVMRTDGNIWTGKPKVEMLDTETGQLLWKGEFAPVYSNEKYNYVIGYDGSVPGEFTAFDLSTGAAKWNNSFSQHYGYGWNNAFLADSTHLLMVADDVVELNLADGSVTTHKGKTGIADTKMNILSGVLAVAGGVAGAMAGGYAPIPYGVGGNVIGGLYSNVLLTDSSYFFSDRDHVARLDKELNEVWRYDMPARTASAARLIATDSTLYMLNYGYGMRGYRQIKCGRPFMASFDRQTGRNLSFTYLSSGRDILRAGAFAGNHAYLMFDDGITYQDINDSTVNMTPWDKEKYGRLAGIVNDTLYAYHETDKAFTPVAFDGQNCPVITDKGYVVIVDPRLNIVDAYAPENIYWPFTKYNGYTCVGWRREGKSDFWLVDNLGLPISHILLPGVQDVSSADGRLYFILNKQLVYLDNR